MHAAPARLLRAQAASFTFHAGTFARDTSDRGWAFSTFDFFLSFFCPLVFSGGGGGALGPAAKAARVWGELSTPPRSQRSRSELLASLAFPIPQEKKLLLLQNVLSRQG